MTATADLTLLHGAILANPAEDAPRLLYADELDELREHARAEFVRVQCELGRIQRIVATEGPKAGPAAVVINSLADRERELFRLSGPAGWWEPLPGVYRSTGDDMQIHTADGLRYTVRRGFVDEVRCPVGVLFGGPCGRCGGFGYRNAQQDEQEDCPDCRGTGTTPGCAKELFACHPVTAVALTDREPEHTAGGWRWYYSGRDGAAHLPGRLLPHTYQDRSAGWLQWFFTPIEECWVNEWATRELAVAAISRAAVALGRSLAKLPPLPR